MTLCPPPGSRERCILVLSAASFYLVPDSMPYDCTTHIQVFSSSVKPFWICWHGHTCYQRVETVLHCHLHEAKYFPPLLCPPMKADWSF